MMEYATTRAQPEGVISTLRKRWSLAEANMLSWIGYTAN
jgi:hypothetical protein